MKHCVVPNESNSSPDKSLAERTEISEIAERWEQAEISAHWAQERAEKWVRFGDSG
jgi:hypothetical protein